MSPTLRDLTLHNLSLQIADAYRGIYNESTDSDMLNDLLNAYRNVRRHISVMADGKRYGATKASIKIGTLPDSN